jgi:predicted RNase H-related nuclease YkuK (DUF458 family)
MDRKFHRLSDRKQIDLISYLREKLSERNDIKIYIGSDSQDFVSTTGYATAIVLHYRNNGGHVLYTKTKRPRTDDFTKHWNEVQDSVDIAMWLEKNGIPKADFIDLDFNPDPKYPSNAILKSALGYVESMGFIPRCKPYAFAAMKVADKICR